MHTYIHTPKHTHPAGQCSHCPPFKWRLHHVVNAMVCSLVLMQHFWTSCVTLGYFCLCFRLSRVSGVMCLFCSVLDHVTHGHTLPVTPDTAQQPTKEQIAKEKESMSSLKVCGGGGGLVPMLTSATTLTFGCLCRL